MAGELVLPALSKWPKYTPEQQELIRGFLVAMMTEACNQADAARGQIKRGVDNGAPQSSLAYWKHAQGLLKRMFYQVANRQRHLAIAEALAAQGEKL